MVVASAATVSSREAERLADLAHRRAAAIGDYGGGDAGAVAAVAAIDILDHLFTPLMLEIDVDVRRLLPLRRDEAFEQEVDLGRVHIGDGEAVADGGVCRRAASLAEDVERAGIVHDVVHGEEIARVFELLDQREFLLKRIAYLLGDSVGETPGGALPGEIFEMRLRRLAVRHRLVGIFVFQLVEGVAAGVSDLHGAGKRRFVAGEEPRHLLRRFEMPLGIGLELQPCVMDRAFLADAGENVLQGPAVACVIEHGAGGDEGKANARRQLRKRFDAGAVAAAIRMTGGEVEARPEAKRFLDATKLGFKIARGGKIVGRQSDEDEAIGVGGNVGEMERAFPLLGAALAKREQAAEPAVSGAVRRVGEQARRIVEIETRADDEFDAAHFFRGKMRADHAGERVTVGDGDCRKPERLCRRHQLLGVRAATQEREIGGDFELGVAWGHFY